jgi:hypothetical protein
MRVRIGSWWRLLKRIHREEQGAVSLETILIVGVIALPILLLLVKYGIPAIWEYFREGAADVGIDVKKQP